MNWGKGIFIAFVFFISFILTIIYKMMNQRIDLVREDYYKEELNYEQQIKRISNASQTNIEMRYSPENQEITFALPNTVTKGEVLFFRPSDKRLDFKKTINQGDIFKFDTNEMAKGRWKIQVYWSDSRNDYFKEEEIFI